MSNKLYTVLIFLLATLNSSAQNALRFDGTDDYAESLLSGPTGYGSRTVEAWVNLGVQTSVQKVILDWGDMATGSRFTLNIINGTPRIEVGNSGFSSSTSIAINTWHHLAATFDNAASPQLNFYLDGVLVNSGNFSVPVYTSAASGIIVGRRNDATNNFPGMIDDVRVWDLVKTQNEIITNMNKEFCSTMPGLVAYFNFNQGVAGGNNTGQTTLFDASGNANNATLYNFSLTGTSSNFVAGAPLTGNTVAVISPSACHSYNSPSGLYTYTASGTYHDTIPNSLGCDSIITINLTVNNVDTSVTQLGATLHANAANCIYQWLDCSSNFAPVAGATFQNFSPAANGVYALKITKFNCTDTSSCFAVTNVGTTEFENSNIVSISPNPFHSELILTFNQYSVNSTSSVTLFDLQGRVVSSFFTKDSKRVVVPTATLESGFYFIKVEAGTGYFYQKILKN